MPVKGQMDGNISLFTSVQQMPLLNEVSVNFVSDSS